MLYVSANIMSRGEYLVSTMKDVAKVVGVSMITVSRVINSPELVKEETRIKVQETMEKMNFIPNHAAKALAEKSTRAIHLYVPKYIGTSDPFIMHLISGISEELSKAYYLFLIRRELEFNQRCDGMIVMGLNLNEEKEIKKKLDVPFVLFGKSELDIDCVDIDNIKGAVMMTEHMIACGHKRIGFIMIKTDQRYAHERFIGYKQALAKNNIPFDEKLVRYAGVSEADGYAEGIRLMKEESPTAIFCCNDLLAIGTFRAAGELNLKIPENISIGGFDGLIYDLIPKVPLTTVKQPVYEAGQKLALQLLKRLKNPKASFSKSLIVPQMILRESVARK